MWYVDLLEGSTVAENGVGLPLAVLQFPKMVRVLELRETKRGKNESITEFNSEGTHLQMLS